MCAYTDFAKNQSPVKVLNCRDFVPCVVSMCVHIHGHCQEPVISKSVCLWGVFPVRGGCVCVYTGVAKHESSLTVSARGWFCSVCSVCVCVLVCSMCGVCVCTPVLPSTSHV